MNRNNNVNKSDAIPIVQTKYGYEQKSLFVNNDLYHEQVDEFEPGTIWQQKYGKGVEILSFILLGDQNSGKSTFIHSFTYSSVFSSCIYSFDYNLIT